MKKQPPNPKLEIIYLPVSSLVKLPGNPRKDTDPEAINKLAALIKAHGFQNPLQVFKENGKYTIIAGNHRFDAGMTLSMIEFPCLVYTGNKKAALARAISDNKSNAWTDWDFPLLKDMCIELDNAGDFDMFTTGFEQIELNEMFGVVSFPPGTEADQGRLDEKKPITCPECGHSWVK
ncbi:MAG: ParB/RepB/Spo0J family partition protein [Bacteroidia bacterium]|nr:ParB/RepB/Spo0J family partition protein [Bacteroidia bacterium]